MVHGTPTLTSLPARQEDGNSIGRHRSMLDERALSSSPRVAFGALSVPSHAATRCFQRATFRALTLEQQHAAAGGWLRLPGGGQVLLHYVMSSPATAAEAAALRSENATHRDLDTLPVRHRESACAEKIFVWLALASRSFAADANFIGILDDDTFVHVERVLADLRPHASNGRLLYGQFSWAEKWDARRARHRGYANTGDLVLAAAARHAAKARGGGSGGGGGGGGGGPGPPEARNGPFPLPLGFMMVLGSSLILALVLALTLALALAPGARLLSRARRRCRARRRGAKYLPAAGRGRGPPPPVARQV